MINTTEKVHMKYFGQIWLVKRTFFYVQTIP